jgi:penicillin-binding protein 1A
MRRVLFVMGLVMMLIITAAVAKIADTELPEASDLQQSSFICDATVPENCNSTNAMAKLSADEDRVNVSLDKVPEVVRHAVVDSEDADFFEHKGVNPVAIGRALYWDIRSGTAVQGGSTITQQFVKNTFLTHEQTLDRKVKEAILAVKVEQSYSKEEILEGYLNTIFFGRNVYGINAAAQAYFNKDITQVTELKEATYLAGLIRAPNRADAATNPEAAHDRRKKVLVAMLEAGHITQAEYDATVDLDFSYVQAPTAAAVNRTIKMGDKGGNYITAYVDNALQNNADFYGLTPETIALGGLRVYTTIDPNLQAAAWDAMFNPEVNTQYPLNRDDLPQGALVSIDDQGNVKALVGGRGDGTGSNFAVGSGGSGRPVGSTFKPIVLAEAIRKGYSLEAMLPAPQQAEIPSIPECNEWKPRNAGESEIPNQRIDLFTATKESVNTSYAHLMYELAAANNNDTSQVLDMAEKLGMDIQDVNKCLTMVLGANNSTPLEMAEVYSTFANGGIHKEPRVISRIERVDQEGNVALIYSAAQEQYRAMTELDAAKVTSALQAAIQDGTGTNANLSVPAAGKTGTTGDNKDAWFVGYTPKLTTAVWMGFQHPDQVNQECVESATTGNTEGQYADYAGRPGDCPLELARMGSANGGKPVYDREMVTGGSIPAIIWKLYMERATAGTNEQFRQLTPEEMASGQDLDSTLVPDTTVPVTQPQGPGGGDDDGPGNGGGNGPRPTISLPDFPTTTMPTTSVPDTTPTTDPGGPGGPGGGGGGGGGNDAADATG